MKNKTLMKTLSAFLAVVMVICSAPLSGFVGLDLPDWLDFGKLFGVEAEAASYSGTCGDNVNWSLDTETGVLNITGTGAMYNYEYDSIPWYSYCSSVKTVNIQKDVTSIGSDAFRYCYRLTSVTIGDSVTSIGDYAFCWCRSLESVTIGDSVTSIGSYAFAYCYSLTSVTIPDSVTSIGSGAFWDCDSLTSVTIPDSVTSIGYRAFSDCDSLTSIKVDSNNKNYCNDSYGVLYNKNKTTLIQYPDGNSRKTFTIPDSVESIGMDAFYHCDSLTSIKVDSNNKNYCSDSCGVLYNKNKTTLIQYPIGNSRKTFTIPDSVESIGSGAFASCDSLTSVTIPDSVESIGRYAFWGCYSLTSVTIPDSVESIGSYAFCVCDSLTSVTIPDSVTSVGDCAFYVCNALTDVYYMGTEEDWNKITIGSDNEDLLNATIHFLGEEEHSHSYTSKVTKPSTCTEEGVITYTCSCGDVYEEFIPALAHTWGEWLIAKEPTAKKDGLKVRMCTICADAVDRAVIPLTNNITILLLDSDGKIIREEPIDGDLTEYTFEDIADGEYTVTVSKANYVTREYDVVSSDGEVTVEFKLNLLGDIDGNGKVNISDYNAILRHVKKTSALDGYAFDCADIDGNGKIMVTDYNAVLRHVKKTEMLW